MPTLLPPVHPDVRLWLVDLDADDTDSTNAARALLSPDEVARADRFVFDHHRQRFVAGRAALRRLLAEALGIAPEALTFTYNASGKPDLHPDLHAVAGGAQRLAVSATPLRFNVSHSDRYALVGVTTAGAIGVDIEKTRPIDDVLRLARTAFSPNELDALRALPAEAQDDAFFAGWTRKEAYIKARGDGLRLLADFDVTVEPGAPVRLTRVARYPDEPARWTLLSLTPAPGYLAAVCVERRP